MSQDANSPDAKARLSALLQQALSSVAPDAADTPIHLERPRDPTHGDFATNLAMQLARALKKNPREIANQLLAELPPSSLVIRAEVAGAGFINFTLDAGAKTDVVKAVLVEAEHFGRSTAGGRQKVQVEFVSANPTGPLHVGHGRGAAYGASLSSLLSFAGWDVTREYYVNDAGRQMDILGLSTWLRYLDQHGQAVQFPPNAYQGDYVREMARQMTVAHGEKFVRAAADVVAGTPGLPDAGRADDEAKQQRELHLDALIAKAKELLLIPRTVGAAEALDLGLATEVVPDADLADRVRVLFGGVLAEVLSVRDEAGLRIERYADRLRWDETEWAWR